jgi:hypothetical protein
MSNADREWVDGVRARLDRVHAIKVNSGLPMNKSEEDLDRAIRAIEAVRPALKAYVEAWPEARRFFAILRGDDE